jgi:copper(I)-binding protein
MPHHARNAARSVADCSRRLLPSLEERIAVAALAAALLFVGAHGVLAAEAPAAALKIEQPWSRATPPGAKVAGGYLVIENAAAAPDRLQAATAEIAGRTEIHEMSVTDGIMRMRKLSDGLAVPGSGEVRLEPGSYHLMFMDLKRGIAKGERFKGTLVFEKAGPVEVEFVVQGIGDTKPPPMDAHGDHAGHGG